MTEAEWLAATDPWPALGELRDRASERKWRLLAVGCCRHVSRYLTDELKCSLDVAERFADDIATPQERRVTFALTQLMEQNPEADLVQWSRKAKGAVSSTLIRFGAESAWAVIRYLRHFENITRVFHCIFGNPFRPVFFDPAWLTPTAVALANGIYTERAFDRMPILADALEEAGCDNVDVLLHCRGDGPHVKGCWVIDAVLGKE